MSGAGVVPVGDIERAVGTDRHIGRGEPGIAGHQQFAAMCGADRRAVRADCMPVQAMSEQIAGDVGVAKGGRQMVGLIDNAADRDMAAAEVIVRRVFEIAVGMRIVQGPVFTERLDVVGALHAMQQRMAAVIGAVKQLSTAIEIESPRISAAFAEQLERLRHGMVPPHPLLEFDATNVRRHRATLATVQPAIGAPGQ